MKKRVWKALLCCVLAMAMLPALRCSARSGHYHHGLRRMGRSTSRLVQRGLEV